jgi:hypothetical protein
VADVSKRIYHFHPAILSFMTFSYISRKVSIFEEFPELQKIIQTIILDEERYEIYYCMKKFTNKEF